jgi:hypothetical protein
MSKFSKVLESKKTGKIYPDIQPLINLIDFRDDVSEIDRYSRRYEYRCEVRIGTSYIASENSSSEELKHRNRMVKELLVEHMFGEFRPLILEAIHHAYNQDFRAVTGKLSDLMEQMFDYRGEK